MTDLDIINSSPAYLTEGYDELLHSWVFDGDGEARILLGYLPTPIVNEFDSAQHEWRFTQKPTHEQLVGYTLRSAPAETRQVITLSDISVTGDSVTLGSGSIWWVAQNTPYTITAKAEGMPDGEMMIIIERIIQGGTVVQDVRAKASIVSEHITINSLFEASGNYQITAERLNQGLATIGAPFRLVFDTVEFDAYVA